MTDRTNDRPRPYTAQVLLDLATDPLDPGYRAAAERRARATPEADRPRRPRWDSAAVALGCLLIGFTLVVAYVHTHRSAPEAAKVHDSLVARVRSAQRSADALAAQAEKLNSQAASIRDAALGAGGLNAEVDREQLIAGETAVHGPGLEVTLSDPPARSSSPTDGRGGSVPITASHILTDRDLRSVVNELWAEGAEAISVNGIRLTPTSAIRFAGQAVLVDFQPISSPYTVRAVGNSAQLDTAFASSAVAERYQTLVSADGIGFSFTDRSDLSLPAGAAAQPQSASVPTTAPEPPPATAASTPAATPAVSGSSR